MINASANPFLPKKTKNLMGAYVERKAATTAAPAATPELQPYQVQQGSMPMPAAPQPQVKNPAPQTLGQGAQAKPAATPIPPAGPVPGAGSPGSTLQDPGQITEAGKAYAQRVLQNLQGNNPMVRNAQATEDTAASRRAYMARKGASEALAQTHFAPGSAQSQRPVMFSVK